MDGHHDLLGWPTAQLIDLDERVSYGLISRLMRSGPMVRQAIFLALAHQQPDDDRDRLAAILARGFARVIIQETMGSVPAGLLATLERLGPFPLSDRGYRVLWEVFDDPEKVKVLRRLSRITDTRIRVLADLDGVLVNENVLTHLETATQTFDLRRAISFIKMVNSTATDESISAALSRIRSSKSIPLIIQRYLWRADRLPPPPFQGDAELRPLTSGPEMVAAGRRFRNCLAKMIGDVAIGAVYFAEFTGGAEPAICEFRPLAPGGWFMSDLWVTKNEFVPPELRKAARAKVASLGIAHPTVPPRGDYHYVRRLLRQLNQPG